MRVPSWLRRRALDLDEEDFREEIRAHLALAREEKRADGLDDVEARYAALREFGNVARATEAARRVWTPRWLDALRDLTSDIRYGARSLLRKPAFSLAVLGVLALGIGLNTAVFTILKSVALAPLAGVPRAAGLVVLHGENAAGRAVRVSYPDFRHLREQGTALDGLFGTIVMKANLGRGRGARQLWGEFVSGNYFEVLGVRAAVGRTLRADDERGAGQDPVVVISHGLWLREFGGDPAAVGRTIDVNNQPLTIVGVADPAFHGTTVVYDVELFVPVTMGPQLGFTFGSDAGTPDGILNDGRAAMFFPHGYLREGVSREAAAASLEAVWTALAAGRSGSGAAERIRVVSFLRAPNGAPSYVLPTLGVLSAMGLLVLGTACANVAGLVLVRGMSRRGELAMRLALGASRGRIVRLLMVENLLLALPGAALGVALAYRSIPLLVGYAERLAAPLRLHFNTGMDGFVLAFAVLAASGSVLVFGFVPALRSTRLDLIAAIGEDASPRGSTRGRLRHALVVAQLAVSLLLIVGAGLAARSVEAARRADPGFEAAGVAAVDVDLRQNGYDEARGRTFSRTLLEALRSEPGVESASLAAHLPLNMTDTRLDRITIDGYEPGPDEDLALMSNVVSTDYFRTLRIPIAAGREFAETDTPAGAPVAIVNRTLAQRVWGHPDAALGKRIRVGVGPWRTVVGVAGDVKYTRVDAPPRPYFYLPIEQAYRSSIVVHVRRAASGPDAEQLAAATRLHIERLDPDLPVMSARPMVRTLRGALIFMDLMATMLLVFGAAGMALAAMGTYGLVSYAAKQRTHEVGIRMALGASPATIAGEFLIRGVRLGVVGAAIGTAAAFAAAGLLRGVLFGISPTDPVSFGGALLVVLAGVAAATAVPAWSAARTTPVDALRHR